MEMPWSRDRGIFYWAVIDLNFVDVQIYCRSEPAREGFVSGGVFFDGVHIHCCGIGGLWFRPYGESLFLQAPKKSNPKNARPERTAPR
jgi:hypothetical protein